MSLLFETIKIQNKKPLNLDYHFQRVSRSRCELFGLSDCTDFMDFFEKFEVNEDKLFKLKIIYNQDIVDYQLIDYAVVHKQSIKFIEKPDLYYSLKYFNRDVLVEIERGLSCNEVGIITKNGYLTDATYANIVLSDGINFYTPENCLLEGTKRQKYIDNGTIASKPIHQEELVNFKTLHLINAMIDLEDNVIISL